MIKTVPEITEPGTKLFVLMIYQGIPTILGLFITLVGYILAIKNAKKLPEELLEYMDIKLYKLL